MTLRRRQYLSEGIARIKIDLGNYVKDLIAYSDELEASGNRHDWDMWNGKFPAYYRPELIADAKKHFAKFKSFEEYKKWSHGGFRAGLANAIRGTKKNMTAIAAKLNHTINAIPNWNGSSIFVAPMYKAGGYGDERVKIDPITSVSVDFAKGSSRMYSAPNFTLFYDLDINKAEIDDVLDAGDRDFFNDPEVEADYFSLVNELRHPGSAARQQGKILKLYTARPAADRSTYDNARQIPSNIFLTTSEDDAFGIGQDLSGAGGRDLYLVKIDERYLIKTLDTGRLKQYQAFSKTGMVPVVEMERVA